MAILASVLVDRVLRNFKYRDPFLTLNAGINNSETSVDVNDIMPNVSTGSIVLINEEYLMVTNTSGSTPMTLTVVRGWLGSTAATHALGDPVYINPRVLVPDVLDFFNEAIGLMYPKLYAVDVDTFSFSGSIIGYGLSADVGFPLQVRYEYDPQSDLWKTAYDWSYDSKADTTDFANGKALMLHVSAEHGAGVRVIYAKPFTRIAASSDDLIAVAGLQDYMTDLLFYYTMARLMTLEEVKRQDPDTAQSHQRSTDVPDYTGLRTADWYQRRFEDLLDSYAARLTIEYPKRTGTGYGT